MSEAKTITAPAPVKADPIGLIARFAPLVFLIVLMAGFAIGEPRFLSPLNLFNIMRQVSVYGLLAVGIAGGWLQGQAITRFKVPPFVVTLGGMSVFRGAALLFAGGGPISGFDPEYVWWGQGKIGPVPVPVIIFVAFAILAHIALRYTRYGRQVYAVGGNPEAARLSGLNVRRVISSVYVIMGFFAGLGAFVLSARLNSSEAVAGIGYELTVIASVVIGGTSLFGGVGTIFGTVIGTVLIGVLLNGLVLMDVSSYIQQIIIGVIIVLAVAFDTFAKSRKRTA